MYRQSKKIVKLQYILHMSHNMVNFGPLAAEIGLPDWGTPGNFNGFHLLVSLLHRRPSTEANQTLHDVSPSPGWYMVYTFSGLLSPKGILQGAKFTLRRSLALSYIGTRAVDVSQTLRRGTRNGIKELSPRAPPIFGRAAITLGIGLHSNCSSE